MERVQLCILCEDLIAHRVRFWVLQLFRGMAVEVAEQVSAVMPLPANAVLSIEFSKRLKEQLSDLTRWLNPNEAKYTETIQLLFPQRELPLLLQGAVGGWVPLSRPLEVSQFVYLLLKAVAEELTTWMVLDPFMESVEFRVRVPQRVFDMVHRSVRAAVQAMVPLPALSQCIAAQLEQDKQLVFLTQQLQSQQRHIAELKNVNASLRQQVELVLSQTNPTYRASGVDTRPLVRPPATLHAYPPRPPPPLTAMGSVPLTGPRTSPSPGFGRTPMSREAPTRGTLTPANAPQALLSMPVLPREFFSEEGIEARRSGDDAVAWRAAVLADSDPSLLRRVPPETPRMTSRLRGAEPMAGAVPGPSIPRSSVPVSSGPARPPHPSPDFAQAPRNEREMLLQALERHEQNTAREDRPRAPQPESRHAAASGRHSVSPQSQSQSQSRFTESSRPTGTQDREHNERNTVPSSTETGPGSAEAGRDEEDWVPPGAI